jgi:hypothetical protein
MVERKRERAVIVRLTDDERAMLQAIADYDGVSLSDWMRRSVRLAFRKTFGADAKPTKRKKGSAASRR